jgi:hypothetical protein
MVQRQPQTTIKRQLGTAWRYRQRWQQQDSAIASALAAERLMNKQLMSDFVDRDDNNNADMQQPTSKERQTNDKHMNNEKRMNDQTMNERTTMNKQTDDEQSNER